VTDVLVVIPWRATDPHREAALRWVKEKWAALGLPVRVSGHERGPWCKAEAVAAGLTDSAAQVVVVADADCWSAGIPAAVDLVRSGAPWAMPHRLVHRLSPEATAQVLAGEEPHEGMAVDPVIRKPYGGTPTGGIVVVHRDVWDDCPLDPRFRGWGHEDDSWGRALDAFYGRPARPPQPTPRLYHLWHPPQPRQTWGLGSQESWDLNLRYVRAWKAARQRGDTAPMRALIEEAR
jgi:hypothetical protein